MQLSVMRLGMAPTMPSSPRLTSLRSPKDLWRYAICLLTDSRYFLTLAVYVILGDALLTQLIIRFVPCTNIRTSPFKSRQLIITF